MQMALDGKAIKEEIPDKEVYDSGSAQQQQERRRAKGESTDGIGHYRVTMHHSCESRRRLKGHLSTCASIFNRTNSQNTPTTALIERWPLAVAHPPINQLRRVGNFPTTRHKFRADVH
jgi:hypothetical protein